MKQKRAGILLAVTLLCVGILVGREVVNRLLTAHIDVPGTEGVLGIYFLEDTDFLQDKVKNQPLDNSPVSFEDALLPYDKESNTLYLSQFTDTWVGELSLQDSHSYVLCALESDEYWKQPDKAIREGHIFSLYAVGESDYYEYRMVVSGMPIISMRTERIEEQEEVPYEVDPDKRFFGSETLHYGEICVFNPGVGTESYEVVQARVCYHLKGHQQHLLRRKAMP